MSQKVVAHFINHDFVKGTSSDVDPKRPTCHVQTADRGVVEVDLAQLKALFFVRDFNGRPEYEEAHQPQPGDGRLRGSRLIELVFADGEKLGCLVNSYPPRGQFFYVMPMDHRSNNLRVLVNRDAVVSLREVKAEPVEDEAAPLQRPRKTGWVFDGKEIRNADS